MQFAFSLAVFLLFFYFLPRKKDIHLPQCCMRYAWIRVIARCAKGRHSYMYTTIEWVNNMKMLFYMHFRAAKTPNAFNKININSVIDVRRWIAYHHFIFFLLCSRIHFNLFNFDTQTFLFSSPPQHFFPLCVQIGGSFSFSENHCFRWFQGLN